MHALTLTISTEPYQRTIAKKKEINQQQTSSRSGR